MRLGDLDALFCRFWGKADPFNEQPLVRPSAVWSEAATLAREAPTIDPETFPVVRQLREELARVTAERDDYKELFFSYRNVCGGHDPQRISELVEADKAGKAIILPIKPGEMAYVIADREILPFHIGNIAVEEWGMSFEGSIEGIGPHRTGPYEKVYFSMEEARAILMKIMVKKYLDYGGDRGGVI